MHVYCQIVRFINGLNIQDEETTSSLTPRPVRKIKVNRCTCNQNRVWLGLQSIKCGLENKNGETAARNLLQSYCSSFHLHTLHPSTFNDVWVTVIVVFALTT